MSTYRDILDTFTTESMPDLDVAVLGALELCEEETLPALSLPALGQPLVVGSGNAYALGQLLFEDTHAFFADESTYPRMLAKNREQITSAVLISASGGKHAIGIAEGLKAQGVSTWLFTNNPDAPAKEFLDEDHILVFPKNREPYTYNTSTYFSMLFAKTGEDVHALRDFIEEEVAPRIPGDFKDNDAFYITILSAHIGLRSMLQTKFDELFGALVSARVFTLEESKHAKTVVPSESERFISFGEENTLFGKPDMRVHIPLPEDASHAAMLAIGYFVIGHIQKQHPPHFKEHIASYAKRASELFGQSIAPIVE